MKEISAATLAIKAFPASSVKSNQTSKIKTASASFDSFLGTSSNKPGAVQLKTDATTQSQPSKQQLKAETPQQTADSAQQGTVQTDVAASQTDVVKETDSGVTDSKVQSENTKAPVADEAVTEDETANFNAVITALNQAIRDIVKDVTGMDDEMLSNAMSALGLTETDLLDTANLAKLVLMLNGSSDATDLLANEYMMSQFNDISDALQDIDWEALTGMSQEEFMPILESMTDDSLAVDDGMAQNANMQSNAQQLENSIPVTVEYVEEDSVSDTGILPDAVKEAAVSTDTATKQPDGSSSEDERLFTGKEGQTVNTDNSTEQTESFNQSTGNQTGGAIADSAQTETRTPVHNEILDGTAGFLQNLSQAVADAAGEVAPQQTSMQQMIDIVNQVVEQIKVTLGKETTSMQMQLNPESLGKVLIHVSSNHGVMTANFTVQTEEAKEALQSQMYNLREALESRSLKVDAVEVEVSDFAFSQSNQADAQDQKEFDRGNGKRFRFSFEDSDDEDSTVNTVKSQERKARPSLGSSIDFTA